MKNASYSPRLARFGDFEADLRAGELRKHGLRIRLQEQPFQVLTMLLEHPRELVTRDELRMRLWPGDTFVDFDHGLNKAINKIREALGDSAGSPRFVETVARRGYRFIASVQGLQRLASAEDKIMLAVLPFDNLAADPEEEFFSDGLTEETITQLGRLNPKKLGVIARTTAMHYKQTSKAIDQIGRELGVDYILEGSVRRAGGQVRITAQLIQCHDQTHLWAQTYDRELADLFSIQSEVAESVARSLELELMATAGKPPAGPATPRTAAYEDYLRGRYYWNKFTVEGAKKAIQHFEQAIQRDPNYAPAYTGLALCHAQLGATLSAVPPDEAFPKAKAAAVKALQIDEALAEAHGCLGACSLFYEWDWTTAGKRFERALALSPGDALIHNGYAVYLAATGRLEEALTEEKQALELDPLSLLLNTVLGRWLYFARRYKEAIEQLSMTFELDANFPMTHWVAGLAYLQKRKFQEGLSAFEKARALSDGDPAYIGSLGYAYSRAGKKREALKTLKELKEISNQRAVSSYFFALIHLGLGETDETFDSLEKAYAEHSGGLIYLKTEPAFDPLRSDLRFKDLVRRIGLME